MHLRIRHEISCHFAAPARNVVAILRLCPQSHEGQHVADWRLDADLDCSLKAGRDEFGNITHTFSARGPLDGIRILAAATIDTFDTAGVVRDTMELLPGEVFLRDTPLTMAQAELRGFAQQAAAGESDPLGKLHAISEAVHGELTCDATHGVTGAEDAFAARCGSAADHAHVFIASARHIGIPSRFISGYLVHQSGGEAACHAWAEAYVRGLGWVGFDTVNKLCPRGEHVRCAAGFDAVGAAFLRATRPDQVTDRLEVAVSA